jgi:Holliday junction DNA helicase RuvA
MIAYLDGFLIEKKEDFIVVDVNGIGYQVFIPTYIFSKLPQNGEELKLFIYHHIREDEQTLYGFLSNKEKEFFELLVSVSGIGPKKGLKLISQSSFDRFVKAIKNDDTNYLSSLKGVGKKTSKKLIFELKDKVKEIEVEIIGDTKQNTKANEAIEALVGLGFSPPIVRDIISSTVSNNKKLTTQELIKTGLRKLGKGS